MGELEQLKQKITEINEKIQNEEKNLKESLKYKELSEDEKKTVENELAQIKEEMSDVEKTCDMLFKYANVSNVTGLDKINENIDNTVKKMDEFSLKYNKMFSRTMDDVDNDIKKAINEMLEMSSESIKYKEELDRNVKGKNQNEKNIRKSEEKIKDIKTVLSAPNIDNATKIRKGIELDQEEKRLNGLREEEKKYEDDYKKILEKVSPNVDKFNSKRAEVEGYIEEKIKNEDKNIQNKNIKVEKLRKIKMACEKAQKLAQQISELLDDSNQLSPEEKENQLSETNKNLYSELYEIKNGLIEEIGVDFKIESKKIKNKEKAEKLVDTLKKIDERVEKDIQKNNSEILEHFNNKDSLEKMIDTIKSSLLLSMKSEYEEENSKYSDVKKFTKAKKPINKKKVMVDVKNIDLKTGKLSLIIGDINENIEIGKCDFAVNKDENKIYYSTNLNDFKEENVEEILKKIIGNNENLYQFVDTNGSNTSIKEQAKTIYRKINDEILKYVENQKNSQENKGGAVKPKLEPKLETTSSRDIVIGRKIKVVENGDEENAKEFKFSSLRYRRAVKKLKEELFKSETTFQSNDKKALFNDIAEYIDGKNEEYKPNKVIVYSLIKDYENCSKEQQKIILDTLVELSGMNGENHAQITIDAEDMSKRSIWKAISTKIRYNSLEEESKKFEDIIEVKGEYRPRKLRNKLLGVFKKNEALNPGENIPKRSMDGIKLSKEQIKILTEISQMTPEKAEDLLKIINRSSNEDLSANYNVDLQKTQKFREQLIQRLSEQINKEEKSDQFQPEQSKDEEEKE